MPSPHLLIEHVADEAQKAPVVNEQTDKLDKAMNAGTAIDVTAGGQIDITDAQIKENYFIRLTGAPAANFSIVVPTDQRAFGLFNQVTTARTCTVETAVTAGTWDTLAAGERGHFHCDGENVFKVASTAGEPVATGLIEQFSGFIEIPEEKTYVLDQSAKFEYNIDELTGQGSAGQLEVQVEIDGTPVTGLDFATFTGSESTASATAARLVAVGARVTFVMTNLDTDTFRDFGFTMKVTRT